MQKYVVRDVVLLSGWLFADLLLGLMVIFLVSIPGIPSPPPKVIPPPRLQVAPGSLKPGDCTGGGNNYTCKVTLSETSGSLGHIKWEASNDMNSSVSFSANAGTLAPAEATTITISSIPCQTGTFTFAGNVPPDEKIAGDVFGTYQVQPVTVAWSCALESIKLSLTPITYHMQVDVQKLLGGDGGEQEHVRQQARDRISANVHIGFMIVYGGVDNNPNNNGTAERVSLEVSRLLTEYGRNGFAPLKDAVRYNNGLHVQDTDYTLGDVKVDVFVYNR